MAAASYHSRILISKYGQTDNVKPLTTNRGLQFAVGWPNLDLKVSITVENSPNLSSVYTRLCKRTRKMLGCIA